MKHIKKQVHKDFHLADLAAGRCPYCLSSADVGCDCENDIGRDDNE